MPSAVSYAEEYARIARYSLIWAKANVVAKARKSRQTLRPTVNLLWGGRGLVTLRTSLSPREPSHQEAHLRKWLPMSTAREHLDLLIAAMDPNKSRELPAVVKVTSHDH